MPADAPPDIAGLIGQYAHGNEPYHHIAYMYVYAGVPYKTQERIRFISTRSTTTTPMASPAMKTAARCLPGTL